MSSIKYPPWKMVPSPISTECIIQTSKAKYKFDSKYFKTLQLIVNEHNLEMQGASGSSGSTTVRPLAAA